MNNIKIFFIIIITFATQASLASRDYPHPKTYIYDYKARKSIKNKTPEKALQENLKILELDTDIPQVHSNLGITFDQLTKAEQAEKSFNEALRIIETAEKNKTNSVSPTDRFQVYYNLGVFYGQKKEIDKALSFYQSALEVNPTSLETKHNIELLIQSQQQQQQQQKSDQEKKDGESGEDQKDKKDDQNDKKDDQKKDSSQDRKNTPKYQPRPFKGEQLGEADVKKILGELSQQDRKIRSQYNKKEQQRENRNAKDW